MLLSDCYETYYSEDPTHIVGVGVRETERSASGKVAHARDGLAIAGHLYVSGSAWHVDGADVSRRLLLGVKRRILESNGQWLARSIQGRYVLAVISREQRKLQLYRDPIGLGTVYYTSNGQYCIFSSELSFIEPLCEQRPRVLEVDSAFVASTVVYSNHVTHRTPFRGIRELRPGEMLEVSERGERTRLFWNPVEIAQHARRQRPVDRAFLRSEFFEAVSSCLGTNDDVYLDLSGGLDSSSVLAACTTRSESRPIRIVPVTEYFPSVASANELRYAREVAQALNVDLTELNGETCLPFSPPRLPSRKWNRPDANLPYLRAHEVHAELATRSGCKIMVDGLGGDQLFQASLEGPVHLADYLVAGNTGGFVSEIEAASRNKGLSYMTALSKTVSYIVRGCLGRYDKPAPRKRPGWLSPELLTSATPELFRPPFWDGLRGLPPCKARQVLEIYDASADVDQGHRIYGNPKHHPFLCQRLVELALAMPIEDRFSQGIDRFAFREAMLGVLPYSVLIRQAKGEHTGIVQLGLRANLDSIEELILNGWLAKNGLVLRDGLRADLRLAAQGFSLNMWPLVNVVSVEMWIKAWGIG